MMDNKPLNPGDTIGDFQIIECIGLGGFGAVYRARQQRLDRDVAVKVMLGHVHEQIPDIVQRFLREIDVVRRLEHPNIVHLYDFGQSEGGALWMAMELVRGEPMAAVMRREGKLTQARAKRIMLQILSGLVAAHEQSIVHRDLKPANIMLTRMGAQADWVKILDFGIGKALDGADSMAAQNLTQTGHGGYGTPRYMAPEQIRNRDIGPHSDVYAAGLLLYELLLGLPAIGGDNTYEILANQISEPLSMPPHLSQSVLGPLIRQATTKEWQERIPTAQAFYDQLEALEVEDTLLSPAPSPLRASTGLIPNAPPSHALASQRSGGPRSAPSGRTRQRLVMAIAALLGLMVLATALWWFLGRSPSSADDTPQSAAATSPGPATEAPAPPAPDDTATVRPLALLCAAGLGDAASLGALGLPPVPVPQAVADAGAGHGETKATERKPEPQTCTARLSSEPVAAAVYLEGRRICESTPCTVELPRRRSLSLVFKAPGFYEDKRTVNTARSQVQVQAILITRL